MLVVTANWGFTDGTLVAAGAAPHRARAWVRQVRMAAIHAGFGTNGGYRPPAGLDVVLAGDTFDGLVSAAWCGRERPWQSGARVAESRRNVLLGCARRAAPLLAGLARLSRRGLDVPAADRRGRPATLDTTRVPVRVTLLVGDRDRSLAELASLVAVRGAIVAPAWWNGTVLVRHGDELDPACHVGGGVAMADRPPTLAESVAVDLVVRFASALDVSVVPREVSSSLVKTLTGAPLADIPAIIAAWCSESGPAAALTAAARTRVLTAWRRAVDGWVRAAGRAPPECGMSASPVDDLAAWFTTPATPLPATLAGVFDSHVPPAASGPVGPHEIVLGHLRQRPGIAAICLGTSALRGWRPVALVRADGAAEAVCVAPNPEAVEPPTVARRLHDGRPSWWPVAGMRPGAGIETVSGMSAAVVDAA